MTQSGRYTHTAIVLHWLVAVLIAFNVAISLTVEYFPDEWVRPVIDTHKSTGITVLGLALMRLMWRAYNPPPPLPASTSKRERIGARAAHISLYALIIGLPLSGWFHDSAWKDAARFPMQLHYLFEWPRIGFIMNLDPDTKLVLHRVFGAIHSYLSYILYGLLALHIAGALKHQFVDKQPSMQRMWPAGRA